MKFIKENLFLVALGSVTVIVAGVLVFLERTCAGQAKKREAKLTGLSADLSKLAKGPHINEKVVEEEQNKVRDTRAAVGGAKEDLIDRNCRNYRVMTFVADGKTHPAFPIKKDLYARVGAEYKIARQYLDEVQEMLDSLNPTKAPTEEEITEEINRVLPKGELGMAGLPKLPTETPVRRPPPGAAGLHRVPRRYPGGLGPVYPTGRRPTTVEEEVVKTPEDIATEKFILAKALKGRIYANKDKSMYMALVSDRYRYSFEELWFAQVSLWVMGDVVEAVRLTNKQASSLGRGVPVSAVKRLVETNVLGYVVRQMGTPGGAPSVAGPARPPTGVPGASPAAPAAAFTRVGLQYVGGGTRSGAGQVPQLTGRACCQLYDVVQYSFTVVMPARHLPRLYKNLMNQNYHVIVDVRVGAAKKSDRGGTAQIGTGRGRPGENRYYYGTGSVVEVTITGELLMLTDWTRGRKAQADPKTDTVVKGYAELMPKEFLARLASLDAQALRPEDRKRVGTLTTTPGAAGPGVRRRPGGSGMPSRFERR